MPFRYLNEKVRRQDEISFPDESKISNQNEAESAIDEIFRPDEAGKSNQDDEENILDEKLDGNSAVTDEKMPNGNTFAFSRLLRSSTENQGGR